MTLRTALKALLLAVLLIATTIACTCIGPVIGFEKSLHILLGGGSSRLERAIIMEVRLPRVLQALVVGAALAASGAALQGLFRNPLASPYVLGVSSGAAFGAALAITLGFTASYTVQTWAFTIGLLATLLAMALSRGTSPTTLLLAGVAMGSLFSALTSLSMYYAGERLELIVAWILGSLADSRWSKLYSTAPSILLSLVALTLLGWRLNVMTLGDEAAIAMGVNPRVMRLVIASLTALAVSSAISVSGTIAFIGLITPHIARAVFGHDHRCLIPASAMMGGLLLLVADTTARSLRPAVELPVGVLTALMGAPFFLYLSLIHI